MSANSKWAVARLLRRVHFPFSISHCSLVIDTAVRVGSCDFVDRAMRTDRHDPRNHTNRHEQEVINDQMKNGKWKMNSLTGNSASHSESVGRAADVDMGSGGRAWDCRPECEEGNSISAQVVH